MSVLFAAIDVGSYELEMAIYEISRKDGIRKIDQLRHVIGLGSDTYKDGMISYRTLDEMCEVLGDFAAVMKGYRIEQYLACATSAVREAKNRIRVLDQIQVRTGLKVTVLSNSEQRFLYYKAVAALGNEFNEIIEQGTAIVDVGSGSIQISVYDRAKLQFTQNIRLGGLRIREMLADIDSSQEENYRVIGELVDNDLETFRKLYLDDRQIVNIIGVGDSIGIFSRKVMRKGGNVRIPTEELKQYYERFRSSSLVKLADEYEITEDYLSVISPALMCYSRAVDLMHAKNIWIPGVNLCDGMAADFAVQHKLVRLGHDFTEDILEAARNISHRYIGSEIHSKALEKNVCELFDSMKKFHGMGRRERLLLQLAAILHDCGKYINMSHSAECSYSIIMATEIIGLSHKEREIVANVVRCNGMDHMYYDDFADQMDEEMFRKVLKLTALLRVGNALDRSHKQKFKDIRVSFKEREMIITTSSVADISLEQGLFEQKAEFFEEIYGIRPVLRQKKNG